MKPQQQTHTVYDAQGNPIQVDSQQFQQAVSAGSVDHTNHPPNPQVVFMTRPHEPVAPKLSPAALARHKDSVKKYPFLNLSEGEFVIVAIRRHPIGLLGIWAVVASAILILLFMIGLNMATSVDTVGTLVSEESAPSLVIVFLSLMALFVLGGVMATWVYQGNRFFLTNESVTQQIQTSLFAKKEQTISLTNIEDASFTQKGILQHMLNYGSLRLSTEGDETTYRFNFVENPSAQVAKLNNAVEAFKNGRPVDPDEN